MLRTLFAGLLFVIASEGPILAQTAILTAKSAVIAPAKTNGSAWDFPLVGKKALPDPLVKLWVYDTDGAQADYGETTVAWDTLAPAWNKDIAKVMAGQKLRIEVWDKDAKYDDVIGKSQHTLTEAMIDKGGFTLSFDQVRSINFEVRVDAEKKAESRIRLMQPYPGPHSASKLARSKDRDRAVILLHGLDLRDDGACSGEPRFVDWQGSTSPLVKRLSTHADVFAIAYAQATAVEEIASFPELREAVVRVKKLGYGEVVVIGHSAGGLLARHLIEEHPRLGITRVVQVATPNGGTKLAGWAVKLLQVPRDQASFVASLSPGHRSAVIKSRQQRQIPASIEFVSVVTYTSPKHKGDGAVNRQCQWPDDLQSQGIPCVCMEGAHMEVLSRDDCLDVFCRLITQSQPRWGQTQVQQALATK